MVHLLRTASIFGLAVSAAVAYGPAIAADTQTAPKGILDPIDDPAHGHDSGEIDDKSVYEVKTGVELQAVQQQPAQPKKPTYDDMVAKFTKYDSGLTLYQDPASGGLFMEVTEDQLGKDFIYFVHTINGVPWAGHFRGNYRGEAIFTLRKYYNRIEFQAENTNFYFDPEEPVSKAAEANMTPGVIFSSPIKAASEDGKRFLIDVNRLFFSEAMHRVRPPRIPGRPPSLFQLGQLDASKSKVQEISADSTLDIVMDYVFTNPGVFFRPNPAVTDPRYVNISIQHSIIPMPEEEGFSPQFEDWRVGYFNHTVNDQTATDDVTPYRDLINKWRLVKKDPTAELSDPVKPITFWVEDTTPLKYRETIKKAILQWNLAFEKAGFSNAVEAKIQGVDGECPARKIDCNVLRWTASPQTLFGGYGPSFYNPRTGEILGADIMLEFSWFTTRGFNYDVNVTPQVETITEADPRIEEAVRLVSQPGGTERLHEIAKEIVAETPEMRAARSQLHPHQNCKYGESLARDLQIAVTSLQASGASTAERDRLIEESVYFLVLHEVGHTLGLMHNMKASQLHSLADIHDATKTQGILTGSVMDYVPPNVAAMGAQQGDFYQTKPGPYDDWAIRFAYDPSLDEDGRKALMARSLERQHSFGNDADDMRAPGGRGIDPRVMIGDMTHDAIDHSVQQLELMNATLGKLEDKFVVDGESWHKLRAAYGSVVGRKGQLGGIIARYVGGVQVERFVAGQEGSDGVTPLTPVDAETQKKAMSTLRQYIFAPDAFDAPADLLAHMQLQRRSFNFGSGTEDPKYHETVNALQGSVLAHLTAPVVMSRLTNSRLYGNEYSSYEALSDLTDAIFKDDLKGSVNTYRQNLQIQYVARLLLMTATPAYDPVARSAALAHLKRVGEMVASPVFGFGQGKVNDETKAHRAHIRQLLRTAEIY